MKIAISINKLLNHKPLILYCCIGVLYLFSGYRVTITNDSVTNLEQIVALDLMSRSSHFTFHLLGIVFYGIFTLLLGLPAIISVEVMLASMSVLGSISLYSISKTYFNNQRVALLAVIIYSFSSGIFRFSLQAEYLILVPSLALISLALYGHKQYLASGMFWALAIMTSPFLLLFLPGFFLWFNIRQLFRKQNITFLVGFFLLYIIISYFTFSETMKGEWSYKVVYDYYYVMLSKLNYLRIIAIWIYGYLRSFLVVIPFIVLGLYYCYQNDRKLFSVSIIIIILHLPVAIPEARYGGYQLAVYPFIAMLAAIGIEKFYKITCNQATAVLLIYMACNCFIVYSERQFNHDLRDTYVMLQNSPDIPSGAILFTYQASKPIEQIYAPKIKAITLLTTYQENNAVNLPGYSKPSIKNLLQENEDAYLLESGMSMPDDYVKLLFKKFVKGQGAKVKGFGKEKLACCVDTSALVLLPKYPIEMYKIKKEKNVLR